ncbi:MAG TPA: DUF3422 domain-containing protein [Aliiroseovarius sp.]|nr:DUF3422 domain-containing protein [Aliiroseovarius sp.]
MITIEDHPLRYALANELHARPFPAIRVPSRAAYLAVKQVGNAAGRDRDADFAHLLRLLDRFGAAHPQPGATHYFGEIGKHRLKWESHSEFVTYTIFADGVYEPPFDPGAFDLFPQDWLAELPGKRITSALIRIEPRPEEDADIRARLDDWFVPESLAAVEVLEGAAVLAGDFRVDAAGHMRFAVFAGPAMTARRTGRLVQRICEIETYKTMAMLGLVLAREINAPLRDVGQALSRLVGGLKGTASRAGRDLDTLLALSAELESLTARSSFRFGASQAYETIVTERIGVLRERRFAGRQTFAEFMQRRFDPAMRTVRATERRLERMAMRAERAGNLLRTRVDVERSAQNQALLESMDRRADLQLRLQETVEGLSVVAISYYAVSLVSYLAYPLTEVSGLTKGEITAILVVPVVLVVWLMVRRIRRHVAKK